MSTTSLYKIRSKGTGARLPPGSPGASGRFQSPARCHGALSSLQPGRGLEGRGGGRTRMQPGSVLVNFGAAAGCHRTSRSACSQAARGETREKGARHARSHPRTHVQKDSQKRVRDSRSGSPMPFSRSESQALAGEAPAAGSKALGPVGYPCWRRGIGAFQGLLGPELYARALSFFSFLIALFNKRGVCVCVCFPSFPLSFGNSSDKFLRWMIK